MHPIERLRDVARVDGAGPSLLAREAATALASIADDPASLVTGCRRLVDHHPSVGPLWWLGARLLAAGDPVSEAWAAGRELDGDVTSAALATLLPDDAQVTVVGWPEHAGEALRRRGDVSVLAVEAPGAAWGLARRLRLSGGSANDVGAAGLAGAVEASSLVLLEASALGTGGFVAPAGSRAAACVARHAGAAVWVAAGVGTVLPPALWDALVRRLEGRTEPWDRPDEVVPLDLVDEVIGPRGAETPGEALARRDCPEVPDLLKEPR